MLQITIPARKSVEWFDEGTGEFCHTPSVKEQTLQLEHSLVSLSKWESKWHKPFLTKNGLTDEETLDYIRCMTLTQNVSPEVYKYIPNNVIEEITAYINNPMTATWFADDKVSKPNNEIITSELIYYWMIALNIPYKYEKWHLNRLLTLIRVCNIKNTPPKKMSQKELRSRNAALNAARKQQFNTRG